MSELLPCPFCGCTAIYVTHTHYYDDEDTVCMFCNGCKSVVILENNEAEGINDKTRAEAIAAWNTRAERIEVYPDGESGISINGITYVPERTCHDRNASAREHGAHLFMWRCSNCGESYDTEMDKPNYCPNCGARVVSE